MASTTATTNTFLKPHSISTQTNTSISHFTLSSLLFKKPTKHSSLSLQNPPTTFTFNPRFLVSVAQTSNWEQDSSTNAVIDQSNQVNWNTQGEDQAQAQGEASFSEPPEEAKLFVGNLSFDVDSEKLAHLFDGAGVVEIAEVIYNRETDRSRGFGFVTMSNVEEAEKAVEMFNSYELNGRMLTVNKAAPRGSRPERPPREYEPAFRIYVGNLPWEVDNDRLEQLFSEHGKVLSARLVSDRDTGRSRGFAFVTMSSETEMNDAVAALDGQSLEGRAIRVNVAEERPRRNF